jgi:trimethylamine corrinoid protein
MSEKIFKEAFDAIVKGDADSATDVAKKGLDQGLDPLELMDKGFIPGINEVGDLFETGRLFLPALIYSATAMEKATEILNAAIPTENAPVSVKIVVGTVEGDVHDIGKTIVVALFKANGFEVMDLGRDVPIARFIEEAEKFGAHIIGSSTLLTTTMVVQKELEQELKKAGRRRSPGDSALGRPHRCRCLCPGCRRRCQEGKSPAGKVALILNNFLSE